MFTLFFIIIFLAELIIAGWIISKIRKANEIVLEYNKKITAIQPVIKDTLQKTREIITLINSKLTCFCASAADKKESCKNLFKNKNLTEIAMWIMKIPFKQIITMLEIILTIRKIIRV